MDKNSEVLVEDECLPDDIIHIINSINLNSISDKRFPKENWQLSQFWYDYATSNTLAKEVGLNCSSFSYVAFLCTPSVYASFLENYTSKTKNVYLFEYDTRFSIYKNFHFYDINCPLNLPHYFQNLFDIVIVDPPFLSEDCLDKISQTISYLSSGKLLICTGKIMEKLVYEYLSAIPTKFIPKHANNLANEFACYSNYHTKIL